MIIRKQFTVTSAHIVRNCYSERCKFSLHAHTGIIEVFLQGSTEEGAPTHVDRAGMLMDFGITKKVFKPLVDLFQDTVVMWNLDNDTYKNYVKKTTDNWVEIPFTPSAELLSAFYQLHFDSILRRVQFANDEDPGLNVLKTRYHETRTGWAEADINDANSLVIDEGWLLTLVSAEFGPVVQERYDALDEQIGGLYSEDPIILEEPVQQVARP